MRPGLDVGLVFQNPDNQLVATTVEDDVAFGLENLCLPHHEMVQRVDDALDLLGLRNFRDYPPHRLSGGQKQRVAIAGVLAMKPAFLVLDEATSLLDPSNRRDVMDTVLQLNRDLGIGVLMVNAITNNDYNLVIACAFVYSAMYIVMMLVLDILYGVIDPRIRVAKEGN